MLNACLVFIMFGVALELKLENFKQVLKTPIPIISGLFSQLFLLPLCTILLINVIEPIPSVALGMILVASCPGGNVSNFFSMMSKGNVALSVSITAISTSLSFIMTPINFAFWSSYYSPANALLQEVNLDIYSIIVTIFVVLLIPLIAGMLIATHRPEIDKRISGVTRKASLFIFGLFVIFTFTKNFEIFVQFMVINR